jgi:hypothetical protein
MASSDTFEVQSSQVLAASAVPSAFVPVRMSCTLFGSSLPSSPSATAVSAGGQVSSSARGLIVELDHFELPLPGASAQSFAQPFAPGR